MLYIKNKLYNKSYMYQKSSTYSKIQCITFHLVIRKFWFSQIKNKIKSYQVEVERVTIPVGYLSTLL